MKQNGQGDRFVQLASQTAVGALLCKGYTKTEAIKELRARLKAELKLTKLTRVTKVTNCGKQERAA